MDWERGLASAVRLVNGFLLGSASLRRFSVDVGEQKMALVGQRKCL